MSIINKQLIINQLPLPIEMVDIIKEYTFYNIIQKAKNIKNKTMLFIQGSVSSMGGVNTNGEADRYWIGIHDEDGTWYIQLQSNFCLQCGNYTLFTPSMYHVSTPETSAIRCACEDVITEE
jgi:hypothetical protein